MKDEKQRDNLVTLKSALKKMTLGAVLAGGLLIPTVLSTKASASPRPLDERVRTVSQVLRKKMGESENSTSLALAENRTGSEESADCCWGNWPNWAKWGNWANWTNWANWGNWGNWANWINY